MKGCLLKAGSNTLPYHATSDKIINIITSAPGLLRDVVATNFQDSWLNSSFQENGARLQPNWKSPWYFQQQSRARVSTFPNQYSIFRWTSRWLRKQFHLDKVRLQTEWNPFRVHWLQQFSWKHHDEWWKHKSLTIFERDMVCQTLVATTPAGLDRVVWRDTWEQSQKAFDIPFAIDDLSKLNFS